MKFARYWQVDLRKVGLDADGKLIDQAALCDDAAALTTMLRERLDALP